MGRLYTPLENSLRTIESMIEECNKELSELRKHWLNVYWGKNGHVRPVPKVRPPTEFDFFFENRERCVELGNILAYLRLKRSLCYDELEGEDSEMV